MAVERVTEKRNKQESKKNHGGGTRFRRDKPERAGRREVASTGPSESEVAELRHQAAGKIFRRVASQDAEGSKMESGEFPWGHGLGDKPVGDVIAGNAPLDLSGEGISSDPVEAADLDRNDTWYVYLSDAAHGKVRKLMD